MSKMSDAEVAEKECDCPCHKPGVVESHITACCEGRCPSCGRYFSSGLSSHRGRCRIGEVVLKKVTRLAVFIHPGQLKEAGVYLVAFCDAQNGYDKMVEQWKATGAICLYEGPPVPPKE
jgi:hypothetical protein